MPYTNSNTLLLLSSLLLNSMVLTGCGSDTKTSNDNVGGGAVDTRANTSLTSSAIERAKLAERLDELLKRKELYYSQIEHIKSSAERESFRHDPDIERIEELTRQVDAPIAAIKEIEDEIHEIYEKLEALKRSEAIASTEAATSTFTKQPQTRQEYMEALVELAWQQFGAVSGVDRSTFRQHTIQEMQGMNLSELKEAYAEAKADMGGGSFLSSGAVNVSHRDARLGKGGVRAEHFSLNGQSMDQSINFDLPLIAQLKGNLDTTAKSSDAVGSIAYNLSGWVAGVGYGYTNTVSKGKAYESLVMMSKSLKGFFVEGQVGAISGANKYDQRLTGVRYLVTLGYDDSIISPFVQYQHLSHRIGCAELERQGVYVGLDTDVLSVQTYDATFTSKVLAKIGYETGIKTNVSAYLEWTSSLKLRDGLEISNALNIGSNDQTVKLNVSFGQ